MPGKSHISGKMERKQVKSEIGCLQWLESDMLFKLNSRRCSPYLPPEAESTQSHVLWSRQCGVVRRGKARHGIMWYSTLCYGTVRYGTVSSGEGQVGQP